MASVKIDLGFGEQAVLSERALSRILTAKHQRDAEEFLRRWPRTRSIQQERTYLQQLGLHAGYNPPGVNPSDASALLRSAVQGGRVTVAIERATKQFGGGAGTPQPTRGSGAITSSRQSFAEMAAGGSGSSAMLSDAASAPKTYSWMQSYDDVSADDLIKYLESVIDSTPGVVVAPAADSSAPLADAQPFEYSEDSLVGDTDQLAGMPFNGAPNSWASSMPGTMPQLRQYGPGGTPMTDIDFESHHGNPNPHAHNWDGTSRDEGAPVSILPW
ncbi:YD repeat-containing protein [Burkholderia pseudomallei]|nr:YD repeat-containing protein [Burkholderia pseudomallei]